jgi:copper chaperone NosL
MKIHLITLIIASFFALGCAGTDPVPINYGTDNCAFCQMLITDHRFGSELITPKGKVFKFDSIECLVQYSQMPDKYDAKESGVYVTSMLQPDVLIDAKSAMFVISDEISSPMGANLAAFTTHEKAKSTVKDEKAVHYSWDKLLKEFK